MILCHFSFFKDDKNTVIFSEFFLNPAQVIVVEMPQVLIRRPPYISRTRHWLLSPSDNKNTLYMWLPQSVEQAPVEEC